MSTAQRWTAAVGGASIGLAAAWATTHYLGPHSLGIGSLLFLLASPIWSRRSK